MLRAQRAPADVQGDTKTVLCPSGWVAPGWAREVHADLAGCFGDSVTQQGSDLKRTMEGVVAANYLTIISVE